MSDDKKPDIAGTKEPLIISPEEAKKRITGKGVRDGGSSGGHAISRKEAVSIAVQVGQEVYDQLRAEHALSMGELSEDLKRHFGEIRRITAANILDIQRRSFSYRIRRDFDVDLQRTAAKLRDWWELVLAWLAIILPLHDEEADRRQADAAPAEYPDIFASDPENVGAPSELPESPEVARAFTLSSHENDSGS